MRLSRYVLVEHLMPFLFGFSVIIFLLVIDLALQMLDRILGKGVPVRVVLELFFLNTAWMIALAVPMAVLVSTLLAFGRLSADGEITALRALGVGVYRVVGPVLGMGALLGIGLIFFNDRILPEFNHRARLLMMDVHRKRPTVAFADKAGVVIGDFSDYRILFERSGKETGMLYDVLVYRYQKAGFPETAVADSGNVAFDVARDEAFLWLYNGEMHRIDNEDVYVRTLFEKARLRLGEAGQQLSRSSSSYRNDREMDIATMRENIARQEGDAQQMQERMGRMVEAFVREVLLQTPQDGQIMYSSLRAVLGRVGADARILHHKLREADRLRVEVHKKYSIPAACLVFVLVGAPLGIWARSSSVAIGAAISIGFFLMWWIFLIGGEKLADRGVIAPWMAMWASNVLTGVIGIGLFLYVVCEWRFWRKKHRETPCAS